MKITKLTGRGNKGSTKGRRAHLLADSPSFRNVRASVPLVLFDRSWLISLFRQKQCERWFGFGPTSGRSHLLLYLATFVRVQKYLPGWILHCLSLPTEQDVSFYLLPKLLFLGLKNPERIATKLHKGVSFRCRR